MNKRRKQNFQSFLVATDAMRGLEALKATARQRVRFHTKLAHRMRLSGNEMAWFHERQAQHWLAWLRNH